MQVLHTLSWVLLGLVIFCVGSPVIDKSETKSTNAYILQDYPASLVISARATQTARAISANMYGIPFPPTENRKSKTYIRPVEPTLKPSQIARTAAETSHTSTTATCWTYYYPGPSVTTFKPTTTYYIKTTILTKTVECKGCKLIVADPMIVGIPPGSTLFSMATRYSEETLTVATAVCKPTGNGREF